MKRHQSDQNLIQDIRPATTSYYRPVSQSPQNYEPQKQQKVKKPKKKFRIGLFIFIIFLLLIIPFIIIFALDVKNFASASEKLFGTSNLLEMFPTKQLDSTSDDTVHILIAGYSADDPGHAGATLTDSIMVMSVNKKTNKSYMLSIPRDLYVEIPGYGSAKINEAYQDGERGSFNEPGYPSGGMGLLTKVVENVTGLDLHYYFLVNYAAVRDTVNALGEITVTIKSPDSRGIYDPGFKPEDGGPLKLPNGDSKVDGQTALNLTRARGLAAGSYGFPQSDFNRAEHQQAVMVGILNELSWRAVLDPRTNKSLFDSIANNVQTDLQINELIPMFRMLVQINLDSVSNYTLNNINNVNYIKNYTTPSGQSALIPIAGMYDYSEIQKAIQQIEINILK